jgi:hypothetical protein
MPALFLAPLQLSLPGIERGRVSEYIAVSAGDKERDNRTDLEILKSVRDYCIWRAGNSWRKLWKPDQRWNPERWDYLDAARLIADILLTPNLPKPYSRPDAVLQAELDIQRGAPIPLSPEETKLLEKTRPALARELLRDPLYTDARLLSGLPKTKLVRMVIQSRQRLAADAAAEKRLA